MLFCQENPPMVSGPSSLRIESRRSTPSYYATSRRMTDFDPLRIASKSPEIPITHDLPEVLLSRQQGRRHPAFHPCPYHASGPRPLGPTLGQFLEPRHTALCIQPPAWLTSPGPSDLLTSGPPRFGIRGFDNLPAHAGPGHTHRVGHLWNALRYWRVEAPRIRPRLILHGCVSRQLHFLARSPFWRRRGRLARVRWTYCVLSTSMKGALMQTRPDYYYGLPRAEWGSPTLAHLPVPRVVEGQPSVPGCARIPNRTT